MPALLIETSGMEAHGTATAAVVAGEDQSGVRAAGLASSIS
jgi:hypothetical protein